MPSPRRKVLAATALAVAAAVPLIAPRFSNAGTPGSTARPGSTAAPAAGSAPAPAGSTAAPASVPVQAPVLATERYTLPNGLQVVLHEDHHTPTVSVNIWYHVGSKDEPEGRNGFAHLFEHLMFQ